MFRRAGRGRLHLPRPAPGALVRRLRHGAGRSGGRVQRPHLAVDLRALPLHAARADEAAALAVNPADADELAAQRAATLAAVIWTTTPWTLPANLAVCSQPASRLRRHDRSSGEYFIVAARLADAFLAATGLRDSEGRRIPVDLAPLDGRDVFRHPFFDRACAPGVRDARHRRRRHRLRAHRARPRLRGLPGRPEVRPADADAGGRARAASPPRPAPTSAARCSRATRRIVDDLRARGALVHVEQLSHSYPHCWRCKNPLIFRATEQWFLRVDHDGLREQRRWPRSTASAGCRRGAATASTT